MRRGLDRIDGWPGKLRGILKSERHEKDILKWFGLDIEIFKELKATPEVTDPNGELYMQYRRHPMHLTAVKQWQHGYEEGESALPSLRELAERRCVAFYGSVLEEEKFKVQKNDDQAKGHKQFRSPETAVVKVLQKEYCERASQLHTSAHACQERHSSHARVQGDVHHQDRRREHELQWHGELQEHGRLVFPCQRQHQHPHR